MATSAANAAGLAARAASARELALLSFKLAGMPELATPTTPASTKPTDTPSNGTTDSNKTPSTDIKARQAQDTKVLDNALNNALANAEPKTEAELQAQFLKEMQEMGEGRRRQFSPEVRHLNPALLKNFNDAAAAELAKEQERMLQRARELR